MIVRKKPTHLALKPKIYPGHATPVIPNAQEIQKHHTTRMFVQYSRQHIDSLLVCVPDNPTPASPPPGSYALPLLLQLALNGFGFSLSRVIRTPTIIKVADLGTVELGLLESLIDNIMRKA